MSVPLVSMAVAAAIGTQTPPALGAPMAAGPSACGPLPPATGHTVRVVPGQAGALPSIVASARAGTTILLADGTYRLDDSLVFGRPGVTLRSASGRPGRVVLDGGYRVGEIIVVRASRVTVAEVTVRRAANHLVHAAPWDGDPGHSGTRLHRLILRDAREQLVKVNPSGRAASHSGRLECSDLRLTSAGRRRVATSPTPCYTGGIDAHGARGWVVRLNRFEGIWCPRGLAEHAVHFWNGSQGTLVERNLIVDSARGIGFGLGDRGHRGGTIRSNAVIARRPVMDTAIGLENASGARVLHNTVWVAPRARRALFSSLDLRFRATNALVRNNLANPVTVRDGARPRRAINIAPASTWFRNADGLDVHLTSRATGALGRALPTAGSGRDIDGQTRDRRRPDIGADEATAPSPSSR